MQVPLAISREICTARGAGGNLPPVKKRLKAWIALELGLKNAAC